MTNDKRNLSELLKSKLPKGYAKIIMEQCGVSRKTVYNILYAWDTNSPVLHALIDLADKHQEKIRGIEDRLQKISQ